MHVPDKDAPPVRTRHAADRRKLRQVPTPCEVQQANGRIQRCDRGELLRRDGEDRSDQELLHVLGALRRAVEREHTERCGDGVHDADHRFLLNATLEARA